MWGREEWVVAVGRRDACPLLVRSGRMLPDRRGGRAGRSVTFSAVALASGQPMRRLGRAPGGAHPAGRRRLGAPS
ncbi:hypothetical protein F01_140075 [Burkholderia cenocepacia]|nr:hypothetical protein F01_140075 [Burkholderia cenocepacia]